MAGNPLRDSSEGEDREDMARGAQLRAGEPQAAAWGRAEPVAGGRETLGGFLPAAVPDGWSPTLTAPGDTIAR